MSPRGDRRQQAIELRLAGLSLSQIASEMGIKEGGGCLSRWLQGVPPPDWTKRPGAKDELRAQAVALRRQGQSYREIGRTVPVSKSTLSNWLRDVDLTEEHRSAMGQRSRSASQKRADAVRAARTRRNLESRAKARAEITELTDRELFVAGVVAYWAEGAKNKPWGGRQRIAFSNADPGMIGLFLRWLEFMGVERDRLLFRVYVHESADIDEAVAFWSDVVSVPDAEVRVSLKRSNPDTNRKNIEDYRGCLMVTVRRSAELNIRISGWCDGLGAVTGSVLGKIAQQSGVV